MAHSADQIVEWVEAIDRHGVNMTAKEEEFIGDMMEKIERYGAMTHFSEAQADWIEAIYTKRVP